MSGSIKDDCAHKLSPTGYYKDFFYGNCVAVRTEYCCRLCGEYFYCDIEDEEEK